MHKIHVDAVNEHIANANNSITILSTTCHFIKYYAVILIEATGKMNKNKGKYMKESFKMEKNKISELSA